MSLVGRGLEAYWNPGLLASCIEKIRIQVWRNCGSSRSLSYESVCPQHMIKYRYIPFTHGKRTYKGKEDAGKTFAS